MKTIRFIYIFSFYFFIIAITPRDVEHSDNKSLGALVKIITALKRNKIPLACILTISTILALIIYIKNIKPLGEKSFPSSPHETKKETSLPLESDIKKIEEMELKEMNGLIACIESIQQECETETKNEEREAKQPISEEDKEKIQEAIFFFKKITEKAIFEEEIKQNKLFGQTTPIDQTTPKGNIVLPHEDGMKYDAHNLAENLKSDTKSCIKKKSIDLLKVILGKGDAEKDFLLKNFKEGMGLLKETSVEKFKNIDIEKLIEEVQNAVGTQKKPDNFLFNNLASSKFEREEE
jgi:hypothetical protein